MASNKKSACEQCVKITRFSVHDDFRAEYLDVPGDGCRLAVSGFNNRTDDTFIDIFALSKDPNFRDVSSLRSPRPYFSREFTKSEGSSWPRYVCLLGDSVFVTCCGDTIELHDTEHGGLVNLRKFTGKASCMAVDGRIYVGLYNSTDVIVFDLRLNQINRITLQRLRERDYPWDMTVNNNNLFICTYHHYGRAFMSNTNGEFQHQYKKPNRQYWGAWSITFCEENGLVYVLWYGGGGKRVVVVYYFSQERSSLPVSHSSLPSSHSSPSDGHCLAAFNVPFDLLRIRRNSNTNTLFAVTRETGEVYEYDTNDIINIENLLTMIELLIGRDDCRKLIKYFRVSAKKAEIIQESDEPSETLLQHLRQAGKISSSNISPLLKACTDQEINQVASACSNYQHFSLYQRMQQQQ